MLYLRISVSSLLFSLFFAKLLILRVFMTVTGNDAGDGADKKRSKATAKKRSLPMTE
jgi:hypothetical protein